MLVDNTQWEVEKVLIFITKFPLIDFYHKV